VTAKNLFTDGMRPGGMFCIKLSYQNVNKKWDKKPLVQSKLLTLTIIISCEYKKSGTTK